MAPRGRLGGSRRTRSPAGRPAIIASISGAVMVLVVGLAWASPWVGPQASGRATTSTTTPGPTATERIADLPSPTAPLSSPTTPLPSPRATSPSPRASGRASPPPDNAIIPLLPRDWALAWQPNPRPTAAQLIDYVEGDHPFIFLARKAAAADWHLSNPSTSAVVGYADAVSVAPGGTIGFHLAGTGGNARVDIFRIGANDATHMLTIASVRVAPLRVPRPNAQGLDEMGWPKAYGLRVPASWPSGVYLAKLSSWGGQSYLIFVVRPAVRLPLTVVLPAMTYQAYNPYGGRSLYGPNRAYAVSFDRPYSIGYGSGGFFKFDFPLLVWLANHGLHYGVITDADLALHPELVPGRAGTLVFSGHAEYWTAAMRQIVLNAEAGGANVAAFGSNLAYWQARFGPDRAGLPARTIICYKDAALDPLAKSDPQAATIQFASLPTPEPASQLFGETYGGMIRGVVQPLTVGAAITAFAPDLGLRPGQVLPGLIVAEVDTPAGPGAALLGDSPLTTVWGVHVHVGAALWTAPSGAHVFDAGTFGWAWGLDLRYAAALRGFPTQAFEVLTARILAWAGARSALAPDPIPFASGYRSPAVALV